jgi:ElaB/YqjD/DUF883 family membrane-anchored ribosome-binding protein
MGRSPRSAVKHALDQVGEETRGILERAHDTADEITARSRTQAEERVERAEREAQHVIDAAATRVRVLDSDADEIWQERKRLLDDVHRIVADLTQLADEAERRFPAEPSDEDEEEGDTQPLRVPIDLSNTEDGDDAPEAPPVPEAEDDDLDELPPPPPPAREEDRSA